LTSPLDGRTLALGREAMDETATSPRQVEQTPWSEPVIDRLREWENVAKRAAKAHYERAGWWERWNVGFGIPVIVLTTVVGTSIFATLQDKGGTPLKVATGVVSLLAAILASVQRFLRLGERAEGHRVAGNRWSSIKRDIEKTRSLYPTYPDVRGDPTHYLHNLQTRMDEVAGQSPLLGERHWQEDLLSRLPRGR
jgi:hypothetical protein